jgi:hypothetical protein
MIGLGLALLAGQLLQHGAKMECCLQSYGKAQPVATSTAPMGAH